MKGSLTSVCSVGPGTGPSGARWHFGDLVTGCQSFKPVRRTGTPCVSQASASVRAGAGARCQGVLLRLRAWGLGPSPAHHRGPAHGGLPGAPAPPAPTSWEGLFPSSVNRGVWQQPVAQPQHPGRESSLPREAGRVPVPLHCCGESLSPVPARAEGPGTEGQTPRWRGVPRGAGRLNAPPSPVPPPSLSPQQFGKILDVEIIFNERGSKVGAAQRPPPLQRRL